ncbi:MAG: hypothetical protein GXO79_13845 [Chlorobi bacterium]|nr:hypothetical protein [Chlorobiota bacterium]
MKKRKLIKLVIILIVTGFIIAGGTAFYMFNMPHRNVQKSKSDYSLSSSQIVNEYLTDANAANEKYLSDDGESKILEVRGIVKKISEDFNNQKVVLLQNNGDKAGVSCSFTLETNSDAENLKIGSQVTIKGVIRSGASYDDDLELYENVILEKCDVVK